MEPWSWEERTWKKELFGGRGREAAGDRGQGAVEDPCNLATGWAKPGLNGSRGYCGEGIRGAVATMRPLEGCIPRKPESPYQRNKNKK